MHCTMQVWDTPFRRWTEEGRVRLARSPWQPTRVASLSAFDGCQNAHHHTWDPRLRAFLECLDELWVSIWRALSPDWSRTTINAWCWRRELQQPISELSQTKLTRNLWWRLQHFVHQCPRGKILYNGHDVLSMFLHGTSLSTRSDGKQTLTYLSENNGSINQIRQRVSRNSQKWFQFPSTLSCVYDPTSVEDRPLHWGSPATNSYIL